MNDQYKTKYQLIEELEQLRQENNLLKSSDVASQNEKSGQEALSLETKLAMVMQGENEKLAWWEVEIPTGRYTFDHRKVELMGFLPDRFQYLSEILALIHPDDYKRVMEAIKGYVEGKTDKLEVEYRIRTLKGEYLWLFKYGVIVKYDDERKPLIVAGFVYNITERKQTEELLYKNEQMFQTVLDHIPGVISWKDTQSRYLGCNKAFATSVGLNHPIEIVGKTDEELTWGVVDTEQFKVEDQRIEESGQPLLHIDELQTLINGQVAWFDKSKIPLRDSTGKMMGIIGIGNNITRLKITEQQLIEANNELMLQYQEKAEKAIALKLALEKAEESDRLKSEFLTNMSHEIRTPMNSILGFAELLKDPHLSSWKQQEFITIIEKSIERMMNIINDIVDYSRIESGQIELIVSETNVNQELETICDFYRPEAEYKAIQVYLNTPYSSSGLTLQTDRYKFYAILAQLMKNAIKFTRTGSIEIGYEVEDHYLEFFVKDTGIGLTDAQKCIIFNKFRQGSESYNKKYEGAGLGLSITKAYVEALGGRIWVENNPNELGSVFYFTLPLDDQYHPYAEEKVFKEA